MLGVCASPECASCADTSEIGDGTFVQQWMVPNMIKWNLKLTLTKEISGGKIVQRLFGSFFLEQFFPNNIQIVLESLSRSL